MTDALLRLRRLPSILLGILALLVLSLLGACHLATTPEKEETFTFPTLKEKIAGADHVVITLKDTTGKLLDLLFDGPVDSSTVFKNLEAKNFKGGKVVIDIEATRAGQVVYSVERGYDAKQGGNLGQIVIVTADMGVKIEWALPRIQEGQTLPLPGVTVRPANLQDPSLQWISRNPLLLEIAGTDLKGLKVGTATLVVRLKADPTKTDSVSVEVVDKGTPVRTVESLTLDPDSLILALRGPVGRLQARLQPAGAPEGIAWSALGTAVSVDTQGNVQALAIGTGRVVAQSKADPLASDTATVQVLPVQKVDSVRFQKTSLDLIAGGAPESMTATVYPALANPAVALSVADTAVARVEGNLVFGRKEGETNLIARSSEDPSKSTSIPLAVYPAENVDSVRLKADSVVLYLGGESQTLVATIHPATLQARFLWKSADEKVVAVDPQGKLSPKGAGKAYVSATARADGRRSDSTLVIVKKDSPRLSVGGDTVVSAGSTVTHHLSVSQDYGTVVMFKADLDGDGAYEDSSATVPASKSYPYTTVKEYPVRFYVRDSEGNETVVTRKVSAVTGRVVQITSPKDGAYVNQTPITVTWIVDGVSQTNSQPLNPGENTVVREATDPAGKVFSHSIKVHLDQTAPNRPVVRGSVVPVGTLTPTWTWVSGGGGGNGTFRYRIDNPAVDGGFTTTDTFHTAATNLPEGAHTLYVQERDEAGNWSPAGSAQIRIDTAAPAAPTVTVTPSGVTSNRRPAWAWTGGVGDTYRYYRYKFGNDDFRSGARDTVGTGFRPSMDLGEGVHTLFVQVRDSAGNWSAAGSATVTLDLVAPGAPTVSGPALTNDATPTWTWSTSTAGTVTFRYRLDNADLSTGATTTTEKAFTPTSNLSEGVHTLYVQESDAAGNWSSSGSRQIRIDVTPPAAPRIDSTPFSPLNTLRPRWTWRSGGGGVRVYKARVDNADVDGQPELTDSAFAPGSDLAEGWRTLYVKERDEAGNWSAASSRRIFVSLRSIAGGQPIFESHLNRTGMAIGNNTPYFGYSDGEKVYVKQFTGSTWVLVGNPLQNEDYFSLTGINLKVNPSNGLPVFAYLGYPNGPIRLFRFSGSAWVGPLDSPDTFGEPTAHFAYTVNSAGAFVVAFLKPEMSSGEFTGWRLFVKRNTTSGWVDEAPSTIISNVNSQFQLFLDPSNGRPVIAHGGQGELPQILIYSGTSWTQISMSGISTSGNSIYSFSISPAGIKYLAVSSTGNGLKPSVYRLDGGSWSFLGRQFISDQESWEPNLLFDSKGNPVLITNQSEVDGIHSINVHVYRGTEWFRMGSTRTPHSGLVKAAVITSEDVPFISFDDGAGSKSYVYKWSFDP